MAGRSFPSAVHCTLLACFLGLVISDVTMALTSSIWRKIGPNTVTSYMTTRSTSQTALRCVRECQQMGSCESAAFDSASGLCHQQASYHPPRQGDTGPLLHVYILDRAAQCKPSDAPDIDNAHVIRWRMTSSSLDGDVSCNQDYMLSVNVTSQVHCQWKTGVWSTFNMAATCKQFAWRNNPVQLDPVDFLLPRPAQVGMCVQAKGTPTQNFEFQINLLTTKDTVLHFKARIKASNDWVNATALNYRKDDKWGLEVLLKPPSHPFPFAVGVSFQVVITSVSLYKFNMQVNGAHFTDFTGPIPVTQVGKVSAGGAVSLEHLIIAC